jgi:hypothetical protein
MSVGRGCSLLPLSGDYGTLHKEFCREAHRPYVLSAAFYFVFVGPLISVYGPRRRQSRRVQMHPARIQPSSWDWQGRIPAFEQKMDTRYQHRFEFKWDEKKASDRKERLFKQCSKVTSGDLNQPSASLHSVLLLAPKPMGPLAQGSVGDNCGDCSCQERRGENPEFAGKFGAFANAARIELGSDPDI